MDSKFVRKHKICIAAAVFLVILLSYHNSFRFLNHTILGRAILVLLILGIASSNIFCGIVAVIYVAIMIYQNNQVYLEGFDVPPEMLAEFKKKLAQNNTTLSSSTAAMASESFKGREGYNNLDRERKILTGQNSNQIPVKNDSSAADVIPTSKENFSSTYSSF
jgi:hypothetical protein